MRALLAEHPDLTPDPNPLEQVGAPSVLHAPVRHSRPMLSLEKATKPEQVEAFFDRFPGQPVVVMPKLDGLSLALVYENGRIARAVTRGDGTTGDDVTVLVRALADGVPDRIDAGGRVEVRGEAVMLRSTFAAYNAAHPDKPLINPRNAAAGTVRAKDPAAVAERRLSFFAFDLDASEGTHADLEVALKTLGFAAADMRHTDDAAAAQAVISTIEAERHELDYDLDGAVLRLAQPRRVRRRRHAGELPRGRARVQVRGRGEDDAAGRRAVGRRQDRQDRPGRPARAGVRRRHDRHARDARQPGGHPGARHQIGDTVLVRRAGDVIPFVAGVLDASKRTGAEREIVPPSECPSCGQPLTEQGNSRELFCTNVACPAQTVRRLIHWASRAAADIEAVGPVWIERLAEAGLLERPSDFYALTKEQLLEFERIGEVSADRMIESIDAGRDVGLRRALIGFAIPMASEGTAARICRAGFKSPRGGRRRGRGGARRGRGHRPEGRREPGRAPDPPAAGDRAAARARVNLDVLRGGPAARGRPRTRRWRARPS